MENGLFFWIIFLKYDIKKNMKFAHGFDKTKRHDQKTLVFASTFPSLYVFPGMEYQETSFGFHISKYTEAGWGKDILSQIVFFQCLSCITDRICQKTPTVQIWWEQIESQYRIPNLGQTIRNRPCNLGQTIRNRPCNLGQTIRIRPCNSGRPIRTRPYGILVLKNARQES